MTVLTPRQIRFADEYVLCGNATEAARRAGYSEKTARQIAAENLSKPVILKAIEVRQAENAALLQITKSDVVAGLLGAIKLAREQQNPAAMISGLVQIAKLCGFFSPESIEIVIPEELDRAGQRMRDMSDPELLAIINRRR